MDGASKAAAAPSCPLTGAACPVVNRVASTHGGRKWGRKEVLVPL